MTVQKLSQRQLRTGVIERRFTNTCNYTMRYDTGRAYYSNLTFLYFSISWINDKSKDKSHRG